MSKATKSTVLTDLRQHTRSIHSDLESTFVAQRVFVEDLSSEDMAVYLEANYRCVAGLEAVLFDQLGASELKNFWRYTQQASTLADDLLTMNQPHRSPHSIGFLSNPFHALGGLYVLMGSQFGKALIRKRLVKMGKERFAALHFFDEPAHLAETWRAFNEKLETSISTTGELEEAKRGAFEFFNHFLSHWQNFKPATSGSSL